MNGKAPMRLYRLRIQSLSPWVTPWQADTLFGMLCWTAARCWGAERLRTEILEPALEGEPPFVLSDAFPGDLLPIPIVLRLINWGEEERKRIKRARWLLPSAFRTVQEGGRPEAGDLLDDVFVKSGRLRNTLSRATGTTGDDGLFPVEETALNTESPALLDSAYLSIYARVIGGFESRLMELFRLLAQTGFGADVSTGRGAFCVDSELERAEWLDAARPSANGVVVLSTFQPARRDPVDGFWEAFTKYGKVGPDFGVENVFKRPLVMLRSGACFRCDSDREFVGRALRMSDFLDGPTESLLKNRGVSIIHPVFGLAVPIQLVDAE